MVLSDVLKLDQLGPQPARDADDPLTAERQGQAELMPGERDPTHAQEGARQRGLGPGGLHHCQQRDAQDASPGRFAAF